MPLYVTETISEFETMYNSRAMFVYFDTLKEDSTHIEALRVKSLQEDSKAKIIYNYKGSPILLKGFDNVRNALRMGRLVVFPSRSFGLVKDTSPVYVQKELDRGYIEMVNTNPDNKDRFDYYAV